MNWDGFDVKYLRNDQVMLHDDCIDILYCTTSKSNLTKLTEIMSC